jgi:AAA+ ATPase superfamily predicted ATPase
MEFIGRKSELQKLEKLRKKPSASLICILGRRRIGKSALIEHWGQSFHSFFEVQGLGPEQKISKEDQLEHFAEEMATKFKIPKPSLSSWDMAFDYLAKLTSKGEWLILLDEVSWLASGDKLFAVKLKSAWDIKFKKNPKLILVVCGSVSTWIEDNILNSAHFLGRVTLSINLKELSLPEINQFWNKKKFHLGLLEKMIILAITGGVPKYLEEILRGENTTKTLAELCFDPGGILYRDFAKIFTEVFRRRSANLEKILRFCLEEKLSPKQLADKLGIDSNSDLTEALHILEVSGFLNRDFYFNPQTGEVAKASHLRVKDNYSRFYLKVIEPAKKKIEKGGKIIQDLNEIKNFSSLLGYQFENLILANRDLVQVKLKLKSEQIISSAPYIQKKTQLTPQACQIDLLIHTDLDVFYLCEFKCKKNINNEIITEVRKKMQAIKIPKRSAIKPVLVYVGEIQAGHKEQLEEYFYSIISLDDLLTMDISTLSK